MTAPAGILTIVARNYLSRARVLAKSLRRTNPDLILTVLVVDGEGALPPPEEQIEWAAPSELPLARDEFDRMAIIYDVTELCTALKPWALQMMLRRGIETAVYLDPDIAAFGALDPLLDIGDEHAVLLTPHCTQPIPRDGLRPSEADLQVAGIYNLGFIAVNRRAEPMLDWWGERLRRDCLIAFDRQLFVDQRWIDQVPALFPTRVLADPGCNVAYWNLQERPLRRDGDELMVGDGPLRFFHFSGLDPDKPWVFSKYVVDRPRVVLSEYPLVAELCDWYLNELAEVSDRDARSYSYDCLPDGTRIATLMRTVYRDALVLADDGKGEAPPPIFENADARTIERWYTEPLKPGERVGRLLEGLWRHRADLQVLFPHPDGPDADGLIAWATRQAEHESGIPIRFLVADRQRRSERPSTNAPAGESPGANVSGYLNATLGLGAIGRLMIDVLTKAGIPVATKTFTATSSLMSVDHTERGQFGEYPVNIVVVNADQFPLWSTSVGAGSRDGRYTIGVWFWELAFLPDYFSTSLELVDEVWVASDFMRRALAGITDKPVHVMPLPLAEVKTPPAFDRKKYGIPDGPTFLFMFDHFSTIERKNPAAVIDAFREAFADGEGPILVIKSINGDKTRSDRERLRFRARGRSDIFLIEDYLSHEENTALLADATCYVSLHRSEGFGLTLAESMSFGIPVIATRYSGNLEFMNDADSLLVDYSMVVVPQGAGPYPPGATWAEPSVAMAASFMRRVVDEPEWAREVGARGRDHVFHALSTAPAIRFVQERVNEAMAVAIGRQQAGVGRSSIARRARQARELVDAPPELESPSRLPRLAKPWRSLAFRALRHHDEQEHLRLAAVADAIQATANELDTVRAEIARTEATRHEVRALRIAIEQLQTAHVEIVTTLQHLHRGNADVVEAIELLRSGQRALDSRIGDLGERHELLKGRVRAEPYRSDPDALRIVDESGATRMGYTGGAGQGYADFEEIFRGSTEFVSAAMKPYLDLLHGQEPVVDLGCGRGEMVGLLRDQGIAAYGVDTDEGMLAVAQKRELDVRHADIIEHLRSLDDGSLGAVVSMQVAEHLSVKTLRTLFDEVARVLRPDGVFILETVNPHAVDAFRSFWLDLTHVRPLYPESLLMLAREVGFPRAEIMFPSGSGDLDVDLDEQGSYALVAWRSRPDDETVVE